MDTLPVTLIVKAPNQQIEDQTIKCELSWTINKLKQHLSEVYPSKPPHHEQKLIYSGQLLSDSVVLKDILRQYEGQDTHTVHLVCTPKYTKMTKTKPVPVPTPSGGDSSQPQSETQNNVRSESRVPEMSWTNVNGPTMTPADVNQYAVQLAWMQQAYIQYMTQYMQLAANSYQAGGQNIPSQPVGGPNVQPEQNQGERAAQAPAAPPAAAQGDPDNADRDWLDVFYMLSRAMVLFSVIYFYSSPVRFILVLFLGFGLYLYQIGFFRNINNNNNNHINGPPEPAAQDDQVPSRLMIVWTFFTTFFASLIPEIPNAV